MKRSLLYFSIILISCGQTHNSKNKINLDTLENSNVNKKHNTKPNKDTLIKLLWREDLYDTTLKETVSTIVLKEKYFKEISEPEKAAIGYVATFIGSECNWDGNSNDNFTNLSCKVIKSLGLGYQCSETHLTFLKHWFRDNQKVLNELKSCPIIPFTATEQNTFNELSISSKKDTIKICLDASGANIRQQRNWNWSETILFKTVMDELFLIRRTKHNVS